MPVMAKTAHVRLRAELRSRWEALLLAFESRSLTDAHEECSAGTWRYPEELCATRGSVTEIRLTVADFQTILKELSRLK